MIVSFHREGHGETPPAAADRLSPKLNKMTFNTFEK